MTELVAPSTGTKDVRIFTTSAVTLFLKRSLINMSHATFVAVAVLESPRCQPGKPKSIIFDAQMWLGTERALVAGLRYFNSEDHVFEDVNVCLIIATVRCLVYNSEYRQCETDLLHHSPRWSDILKNISLC